MRRADREITDTAELVAVVNGCEVCRLALTDGNTPYIVPMNYGFEYADGKLTLYFHGASVGKKMDLILQNPVGCFEVDRGHRLIKGDAECSYSMEYESVIGSGRIEICTSDADKRYGLSQMMKKYVPEKTFDFSQQAIDGVTVFKLVVEKMTGKRNMRK
jgi:Predicted flavin-nucleotide-binding protein